MNILVINCGSLTVKFQVINVTDKTSILNGLVNHIGKEKGHFKLKNILKDEVIDEEVFIENHKKAFDYILEGLDKNIKLDGISHRFVHGGDYFREPTLMTSELIKKLEEYNHLAPLHNPYEITGLSASMEVFPKIPHVASFDTAFYMSRGPESLLFSLPYEFYEKYKIHKYGFHGMSHKYVSKRAAGILQRELKELKIVSCHLGGGITVTAIKDGTGLDCSCEFGTMSGPVMGTRAGVFDPALILYMIDNMKMGTEEISDIIYNKSGLLGISGTDSDIKSLAISSSKGDRRAELALNMFFRSMQKFIGSYIALMKGADILIFTGGVGTHNPFVREKICSNLEYLNTYIDKERNQITGKEAIISTEDSKIKIMVIPTEEELIMAEEAVEVIFEQL